MQNLSPKDRYYKELKADFVKMSEALLKVQRPDGFWNASLVSTNYEGPEVTGTSLFLYGMSWGINHGVLNAKKYRAACDSAWKAMAGSVHADGFLGWNQGTGADPSTGQPVTYTSVPDFEDYGTGCFLLMNTGKEIYQSKNGLVTTIAISLDGEVEYALEGSVFVGGAVIQWIRDGMHMIQDSCDSEYYAQKVPDNGGVYIVPAFTGLGAPYWDMYARGAILGITRGTTQNHIIRAAEESIAYQSADLMGAMEKDTGIKIKTLKVDGGASRDQFLMQFQADILDKVVQRPAIRETTALGAAYLAGLATGVWKSREEITHLWSCNQLFEPKMDAARREELLEGWHKAVGRSQDWAKH